MSFFHVVIDPVNWRDKSNVLNIAKYCKWWVKMVHYFLEDS